MLSAGEVKTNHPTQEGPPAHPAHHQGILAIGRSPDARHGSEKDALEAAGRVMKHGGVISRDQRLHRRGL